MAAWKSAWFVGWRQPLVRPKIVIVGHQSAILFVLAAVTGDKAQKYGTCAHDLVDTASWYVIIKIIMKDDGGRNSNGRAPSELQARGGRMNPVSGYAGVVGDALPGQRQLFRTAESVYAASELCTDDS